MKQCHVLFISADYSCLDTVLSKLNYTLWDMNKKNQQLLVLFQVQEYIIICKTQIYSNHHQNSKAALRSLRVNLGNWFLSLNSSTFSLTPNVSIAPSSKIVSQKKINNVQVYEIIIKYFPLKTLRDLNTLFKRAISQNTLYSIEPAWASTFRNISHKYLSPILHCSYINTCVWSNDELGVRQLYLFQIGRVFG